MNVFSTLENKYSSVTNNGHSLCPTISSFSIEGSKIRCSVFIIVLTKHVVPFLKTQYLFNLMKVDWNVCQHASKIIFSRIRDFLIQKYCSMLSFDFALEFDQKKILDREMADLASWTFLYNPNFFIAYALKQQQFDFCRNLLFSTQSLYNDVFNLAQEDK